MTAEQFSAAFEAGYIRTVRLLIKKGCRDAEDVASEGWATAWEKREQFADGCRFVNWVAAITLNVWRARWRRAQFKERRGRLIMDRSMSNDPNANICAQQVLSMVSIKHRRLLTSRYLEDREFNEIASTTMAGRLQVHRAVKAAREVAA